MPDIRKDLHGDAIALANDAKQQVLGRDVVLAELQSLAQRALEHALGPRRERNMTRCRRRILLGDLLDLADDLVVRDVKLMQGTGCDALAFANQTEKQMLGAHIGLLQLACFLLCEDQERGEPYQ